MLDEQPFIGRARELSALEHSYDGAGGELVLLYGRRRIGTTYLLQRFTTGRRTIFYQATRQAEADELRSFTEQCGALLGPLPPGYTFPTWEAALEYLDTNAGTARLAVILDEFPYLCESTAGLASVVQRWWDRRGRASRIMLVLCGSAQAFMAELDAGSAPLHQRFTKKIALGPLSYREAAEFVPSLDPADRARVFGIVGGTPLYLREWRAGRSMRATTCSRCSAIRAVCSSIPRRWPCTPISVMPRRRTARWRRSRTAPPSATTSCRRRASPTNVSSPRLEELRLVAKRVPVTEGPKSRRGLFALTDPYFQFWFRFIEPHRATIDRGFGGQLVDGVILPGLDGHMGPVFEELARAFAVQLVTDGQLRARRRLLVVAGRPARDRHRRDGAQAAGVHRSGEMAACRARPRRLCEPGGSRAGARDGRLDPVAHDRPRRRRRRRAPARAARPRLFDRRSLCMTGRAVGTVRVSE